MRRSRDGREVFGIRADWALPLQPGTLPLEPNVRRVTELSLVSDREHYDELVLRSICRARVSIWIATATLKDVHVEAPVGTAARARGRYVSLMEQFVSLVRAGVEIRILHGAPPSRRLRATLAGTRELAAPGFELRQCPRVHLKLVVVDGAAVYLGSANFTGAGLGAKGEGRRNFEMGVVVEDDVLLDTVQSRFDRIWSGRECGACRLRSICPKPLDQRDAALPPAVVKEPKRPRPRKRRVAAKRRTRRSTK